MRLKNLAVHLRRSIFFATLCGLHLAYAQGERPPVRLVHPGLDTINALVESKRYKEAIDRALSRAQRLKGKEDWEGYLSSMLRAAEIETFEVWKAKGFPDITITKDYRRPLHYLSEMYSVAGQYISSYPYLDANARFTQAVVYDLLNMPDTAEQMHLKALQQRTEVYGPDSREVADSYLWIGELYNWGLQRKELAKKYYLLAVPLQKKFLPESRYALGTAYYGLATIARKNFQFDEVETMARLYRSLYDDLPYEQAFAYQLVANMYFIQGDYEASMQTRKKSVEIYEASGFREDLMNGYANLSSDLRALGRYNEARKVLEKGLDIWERSRPRDTYHAKILYENLGDLYRMMKQFDSAEYYFDKAMESAVQMIGDKREEIASIYDARGRLFMDKGDYARALNDFQEMLSSVALSPGSVVANEANLLDEHSPYFYYVIAAYFNKGDALTQWYYQDNDVAHLEQALDNYKTAYRQIVVARQSIGDDLSKPFLMSNFAGSIERSIQCGSLLYALRKERKVFEAVLHFAEYTKYMNVVEALARAERANNSGIPKSLLVELEEVRSELNIKQRNRLASEGISADSTTKMNEELAGLINQRRELMARISRYPGNSRSGAGNLLIGLDEIQTNLASEEQLLEYYWGLDSVYVLSITNDFAGISSVPHTAGIDTLIASAYRTISGDPSFDPESARNYARATSGVYKLLLEPVLQRKRIIIVADGPLSLLPAEALVMSGEATTYTSFQELKYLVYDYDISYAYSSSIFFKNRTSQRSTIENVLAFSYSGKLEGDYVARRGHQEELPGTYVELEALTRLYDRVARFTDDGASKFNFINNTAGYDLIHLGVHGVGDQEVADNSRLIFKGDSTADSILYAYEIYNLNLDAGLVVLSACETGIGRNQTGEGVLSIARGFVYAGCPSVVMSLWEVPDIFTSSIITGFYEHLKAGKSVSTSLRNSKLQFLQESDMFTAHPAHWAAFVVNGQDLVFRKNSGGSYWLAALIVAIAAVGGFIWYRRARARKAA